MKQKIAALIGLTCMIGSGAYVYEQQKKPVADPSTTSFEKQYHKAKVDYGVIEPVLDSYSNLSGKDSVIKKAVRIAWDDARKGDYSVFLAIIAMQNQQLIEQNQRMISLMEKKK